MFAATGVTNGSMLKRRASDLLVGAEEKGVIVGSIMIGHDGHRGWIYYVAAHPDYRKRGIGRQMTYAAEEWLRERGIVKVMLLVRDTNTQVVDFYNPPWL
jgi:ribosomal protein S18 acetylase RimI-like enzyme